MSLERKIDLIKQVLNNKKVVVAFSGGLDSSVVVYLAKRFAKDTLAVTIDSPIVPRREIELAKEMADKLGVKHVIFKLNHLNYPEFVLNKPDRCYHCKKQIIRVLKEIAKMNNFEVIVDGTNLDDVNEFRPGLKALIEEGVVSPLITAEIGRREVEIIASRIGLSIDRPRTTCLATRIPFGYKITIEKLNRIERAEEAIRRILEVKVLRVRDHENLARIEVGRGELEKFFDLGKIEKIVEELKKIGYRYVSLDLEGYRPSE